MADFDNTAGRKEVERQVDSDLSKDYKWLLIDIHEELLYNHIYEKEIAEGKLRARSDEQNTLHAQKRIASLQVKIALSADSLQSQMKALTNVIIGLTVVYTAASIISILK